MSTHNQHTIFNIKQKSPKNFPNLQLWDFSYGLKNEFETAMVNEPSVFEPPKLYTVLSYPCYQMKFAADV